MKISWTVSELLRINLAMGQFASLPPPGLNGVKHEDGFRRTWWSVLSIDKLVVLLKVPITNQPPPTLTIKTTDKTKTDHSLGHPTIDHRPKSYKYGKSAATNNLNTAKLHWRCTKRICQRLDIFAKTEECHEIYLSCFQMKLKDLQKTPTCKNLIFSLKQVLRRIFCPILWAAQIVLSSPLNSLPGRRNNVRISFLTTRLHSSSIFVQTGFPEILTLSIRKTQEADWLYFKVEWLRGAVS